MAPAKRDMLPGTLDMLVLKTLTVQTMHGYGIAQHIQKLSRDVLQVEEGSLYPALQRMRQRGLIKAEWGRPPTIKGRATTPSPPSAAAHSASRSPVSLNSSPPSRA